MAISLEREKRQRDGAVPLCPQEKYSRGVIRPSPHVLSCSLENNSKVFFFISYFFKKLHRESFQSSIQIGMYSFGI